MGRGVGQEMAQAMPSQLLAFPPPRLPVPLGPAGAPLVTPGLAAATPGAIVGTVPRLETAMSKPLPCSMSPTRFALAHPRQRRRSDYGAWPGLRIRTMHLAGMAR